MTTRAEDLLICLFLIVGLFANFLIPIAAVWLANRRNQKDQFHARMRRASRGEDE